MRLPYCPNCREPLPQDPLPWLCQRPIRKEHATQHSKAEQDKLRLLNPAKAGVSDSYLMVEDDLCDYLNEGGSQTCAGRCKQPRIPGYFLEMCPNPSCGQDLPDLPEGLDVEPGTVTISGVSGAGKTTYIVALREWWSAYLPDLRLTPMSVMGRKVEQIFQSFRHTLLEDRKRLAGTAKGGLISFSWLFMPSFDQDGKSLLLTLPDVSGERLGDAAGLRRNRHYDNSRGIILLLDGDRIAVAHGLADPVSIRAESNADGSTPSPRRHQDHMDVINAMVVDLVRRCGKTQMANIKLAVCVNKIDKLCELDERWMHLAAHHQPDHSQGFDFYACEARSNVIRTILSSHPETRGICSTLYNNFGDNVMYFAIATLGSDMEPIEWSPYAVGDPFLWILYQAGIIGNPPTAPEYGGY